MRRGTGISVHIVLSLCSGLLRAAAQPSAGPTDEEVQKITAAAPERPSATPLRPRKLLVFNRNEGFNHTSIPYGAKAIEILGMKTGAFKVVQSEDLGIFTSKRLKPFDAIFFNNGYAFKLDDGARRSLVDFVKGGKGLAGIHAASANFEGWPEGTQLFGAKFKSHPWVPKAEWAVKNEQPADPLNAAFGGRGFRVKEEVYAFSDFHRERERVLLSLDLENPGTAAEPHDDKYVPISWVHRFGKGRVFFCSLGHMHDLFWNPTVLRHYLDGIQFALGDLKADTSPDNEWVFEALIADRSGDIRQPLIAIDSLIRGTVLCRRPPSREDQARLAGLEQQMLRVVRSDATPDAKRAVGQLLSEIATAASVQTMARMLSDPELSHMARAVLEAVGSPEAAASLRAALPEASGRLKAGLINSLGNLHDRQAVSILAALLNDADTTVARAAINALGRIGGLEAAKALSTATVPEALQRSLDDACALCADGLVAKGKGRQARTRAEAIYLMLSDEKRSPLARALGLHGLVAVRSSRALPLVLSCLEGPDAQLQRRAARLCASLKDKTATSKVLDVYPKLSPSIRTVLLEAVADRGDPAALPVAREALTSDDPNLRAAAIYAVGVLAGLRAVQPLVEIAASGEPADRQVARRYLIRLSGKGVDKAIEQLAQQGQPQVRAVLMSVMADRNMQPAIPTLLQAARDKEAKVAVEALKALARMARSKEYGELVKLLQVTKEDEVTQAAQDAVVASARRMGDPDKAAGPILAALPHAFGASKCSLLGVLAEVGGDKALVEITKATNSPDPEVKRSAVLALAESWEDTGAFQTLLDIAKSDPDNALRVQALRGYLRLLGQSAQSQPEETVAKLTEALNIAQRPEEKKQVLSVARECRVPSAAELAAKCLDDTAVRAEAVDAVLYLTRPQRKGGTDLPAVIGPAATAALGKLSEVRSASLPRPWTGYDIGQVSVLGWVEHANGTFTIKAAGADIWGVADGGFLICQSLPGDGSIVARVVSVENTNVWAKAGVMIRETLQPGSANAFMAISPVNGGDFQWRDQTDGGSNCLPAVTTALPPYWVKLTRTGDVFTGFISPEGREWRKLGEVTVKMAKDVLVGLAVSSHADPVATRAVFDGVEVTK